MVFTDQALSECRDRILSLKASLFHAASSHSNHSSPDYQRSEEDRLAPWVQHGTFLSISLFPTPPWKTKQFWALGVDDLLHDLQVLFLILLIFLLLHFLTKGLYTDYHFATQGDNHFGSSPHISTQFRAVAAGSKESIHFSQSHRSDRGASQK